uniref:Uncharacterized protein n=1 Tax=Lepeophtheirus salmonis TaxID=72036 RepID=A0A0K2U9C1_LEPSM
MKVLDRPQTETHIY